MDGVEIPASTFNVFILPSKGQSVSVPTLYKENKLLKTRKSVPFRSKINLDNVFKTTFHKPVNIQRKAKFEACTKASL